MGEHGGWPVVRCHRDITGLVLSLSRWLYGRRCGVSSATLTVRHSQEAALNTTYTAPRTPLIAAKNIKHHYAINLDFLDFVQKSSYTKHIWLMFFRNTNNGFQL